MSLLDSDNWLLTPQDIQDEVDRYRASKSKKHLRPKPKKHQQARKKAQKVDSPAHRQTFHKLPRPQDSPPVLPAATPSAPLPPLLSLSGPTGTGWDSDTEDDTCPSLGIAVAEQRSILPINKNDYVADGGMIMPVENVSVVLWEILQVGVFYGSFCWGRLVFGRILFCGDQ